MYRVCISNLLKCVLLSFDALSIILFDAFLIKSKCNRFWLREFCVCHCCLINVFTLTSRLNWHTENQISHTICCLAFHLAVFFFSRSLIPRILFYWIVFADLKLIVCVYEWGFHELDHALIMKFRCSVWKKSGYRTIPNIAIREQEKEHAIAILCAKIKYRRLCVINVDMMVKKKRNHAIHATSEEE